MKDIPHHKKKIQKKVIIATRQEEALYTKKRARIKMIARGYAMILALDLLLDNALPKIAVDYYEGVNVKPLKRKRHWQRDLETRSTTTRHRSRKIS